MTAHGTAQHHRDNAPSTEAIDVADVLVSTVTYNSGPDVLRSLASIAAGAPQLRVQVVVVDNGSADGIPERIEAEQPEVHLVRMGENTGFARANNRAFAELPSRYVLTLNPDTIVAPGAIATLVRFSDEHPGAGVVAPSLRNADGSDQGTARAFPTAWAGLFGRRSVLTRLFPRNRFSRRFLTGLDRTGNAPFRCEWVSGACMLVPRTVLDRVGPFDERYFLFWEDADWCRRIVDAGYEVWTVPDAVVLHDEGGSRRGWPAPVVRSFHAGAYRYWATHVAPQPWNPLRWTAAVALTGRAALLLTRGLAGTLLARTRRSPRRAAFE